MGSPDSSSIRAAQPQEACAWATTSSCACGTPIGKLSGLPVNKRYTRSGFELGLLFLEEGDALRDFVEVFRAIWFVFDGESTLEALAVQFFHDACNAAFAGAPGHAFGFFIAETFDVFEVQADDAAF